MKTWYIPNTGGDYRLEADPEGEPWSVLTVQDPTPREVERLQAFLRVAIDKGWVEGGCNIGLLGLTTIKVKAPVAEAGPHLVVATEQNKPGTLTAVKSERGELVIARNIVEALGLVSQPTAEAAVTVQRATPCCPSPEPSESEVRASAVLSEFLTAEEWACWMDHGYVLVTGGYSGHQYRICHRASKLAATQGRVCADLTDGAVLHFHDSHVPPPEEVLGAVLVLKYREDWLRNPSTCLSTRFTDVYSNPLGPEYTDGIPDSQLLQAIGGYDLGMRLAGAILGLP